MKRKLLSLALALVMTVLLLPRFELPAQAATYEGSCGDNITWTFDTETGVLNIEGTGAMPWWGSNSAVPWSNYNYSIKSAVVSEGITSLGFCTFFSCRQLESVSLPSTLRTISSSAFKYCTKLSSLTLPAGVTSISYSAFQGCSLLTSIDLPQGLTKIEDNLFSDCSKLQSVTLPANCTSIGSYAFYGCALTQLTLPSGLRTISSNAFENCKALQSVTIPAACSSVGSRAFAGSGLTSITIPATVTQLGAGAFANCSALTAVAVADGSPICCAVDGVLFSKDRTQLMTYPAGRADAYEIPADTVSIAANAFAGNCSLTELTVPENVTSLGDSAFLGCQNLEALTVCNKTCVFPDGALVDSNPVLYGYMESTAHTYADANGLCFVPLDGCEYGLHEYALAEQQFRTDATDGYRLFRCANCGKTYTDVFPAWNTFPPLTDGACLPLPAALMQSDAASCEQYACAALGGIYFREDNLLYCYFPRSGELYLAHTFSADSLYYCDGALLYALEGTKLTVYDLAQMNVVRTARLPQAYAFTAVGVDAAGRIYTAGKAAASSADSIYLYDAQGTLLSEVAQGSLAPITCFAGFDLMTGRFYAETNLYYWISYPAGQVVSVRYSGDSLSYGTVADGVLRLESKTTSYQMVGHTLYVRGLNVTLRDGHWRSAELLHDGSVMCVSSLLNNRRILRQNDLTADWTLPYLPADSDGEGGTLPSAGTRSLELPERGSLLCYEGNCLLQEYDPDTHAQTSAYQTAHPVYSLCGLDDLVAAVETDGSAYYLELIDWSLPTQITVTPETKTMTVGEEASDLTVQTNRLYTEAYCCNTENANTVFVAGREKLVAMNPGTTRINVTSLRGGPSACVTVRVLERDAQAAGAQTVADTAPNNIGDHSYSGNYGHTVWSYLTETSDGSLERVYYSSANGVICSIHAADGTEQSRRVLEPELSSFGGYFRGADGRRYLVFGKSNPNESDEQEVLRVVQYSADWTRLGACSVFGANTTTPFLAGSLRMAEADGKLYIHTCHEMYKSNDGLNHQANMSFVVSQADMSLLAQNAAISNFSTGYVSHSFNQFVLADGDSIYRVDHGDAYPRAVCISAMHTDGSLKLYARSSPFPIQGSTGANATGVKVGALKASSTSVLFAGTSVDQSDSATFNTSGQQNVFVVTNSKDLSTSEILWLTNYTAADKLQPDAPYLVKLSDNQFLLMWEERDTVTNARSVVAMRLNADGTAASAQYRLSGLRLSDCEPILCADGTVCWYTTDGTTMTFYRVDPYHLETWPETTLSGFPFEDVDCQDYFFQPVYWAVAHEPQITCGVSPTSFGASRPCTREQFATFLWRTMGAPTTEGTDGFTDVAPTAYYADAVRWAAAQGITGGIGENRFGAGLPCTRAQAVTFLWRAAGSPAPVGTELPFDDVAPDKYYYQAVRWAAEQGIVAGVSETKFAPNRVCSRAQTMTMLYKLVLAYTITP